MHGSSTYKIYREGPIIYDAMLNQTNLQFNNNKYYLIQLLEKNGTKNYSVWLRWGRVGKTGQFTFENYGTDLDGAKNFFCKKFLDKTKNDWASKDSFEKYPGKYDLVEKDYSSNEKSSSSNVTNDINVDKPKIEIPPSKLDKNLQNLIELICNVTEMENLLKEMKFDAEKAPLGKLSKNQIKAGYSALKEIEDHILKNKFGSGFIQANNDFYTRIPHSFGYL
jgi:poly [ADP-ribose] polymerase 2/3/4